MVEGEEIEALCDAIGIRFCSIRSDETWPLTGKWLKHRSRARTAAECQSVRGFEREKQSVTDATYIIGVFSASSSASKNLCSKLAQARISVIIQ